MSEARRALLDVNVLLALFDPNHTDHERAGSLLDAAHVGPWATCPITENGFIRVLSQPAYPTSVSPHRAVELVTAATERSDHERWSCDLSTLDPEVIDARRLHGPRQVTDVYLLALAAAHGGRFVTFDRAVPTSAVVGASSRHLLVL